MLFKNVIGQGKIKLQLLEAQKYERLGHALLFIGPEGSGNLAMALALAQYVNCLNPNETDSCGECNACLKINEHIHPDIHFSYPFIRDAKAKEKTQSTDYILQWREIFKEHVYFNLNDWLSKLGSENKQGNISAFECNQIIKKISLRAFEGKRKVLIIWQAELLGKEGNILLKTIEEPPKGTLIILIGTEKNKILNTIQSRTQHFSFPPILKEDLSQHLMHQFELNENKAGQLALISNGNFRKSLNHLDSSANEFGPRFQNWLKLVAEKDHINLKSWSDDMGKLSRDGQKAFLQYALELFGAALIRQITAVPSNALNNQEQRIADWICKKMKYSRMEKTIELLERSHSYLERNAHSRLLFFNLSIYMTYHL